MGFASNRWNLVRGLVGTRPKEQNPTLAPKSKKVPFSPINELAKSKKSGSNCFWIKTFRGSGSLRSITVLALELYQTGITQSCHPNLQIKSRILCLYKNLGNQRTSCIKIKIGIFGDFFRWVNHWVILFYLLKMIIAVFH